MTAQRPRGDKFDRAFGPVLRGEVVVHLQVAADDHGDHTLIAAACGFLYVSGWAARIPPRLDGGCAAVMATPGIKTDRSWMTPEPGLVTCPACRRALSGGV